MTNADLVGYWRITSMERWGADYIDLVVPGFSQSPVPNRTSRHRPFRSAKTILGPVSAS